MSNTYTVRVDANVKVTYENGKTFIESYTQDYGQHIESRIEITNISATILALQDIKSLRAKEW